MTAKAITFIAAGVVAAAGTAGTVWYVKSRPAAEGPAMAPERAPAAANLETGETLDTAGPKTLILKVVTYHGVQTLGPGADTSSRSHDISAVFAPYRLNVTVVTDGPNPYPFSTTEHLTRSQLDSLDTVPQADGTGWKVTAFMLDRGVNPGDRGLLLKEKTGRNQFAVFTNGYSDRGRILRSAAHELGHALNLFHSDGDGTEPCCASTGRGDGTSLMNQDRCLDKKNWLFTLSDDERRHLLTHPLSHIEPGTTVPFGTCSVTSHSWRC